MHRAFGYPSDHCPRNRVDAPGIRVPDLPGTGGHEPWSSLYLFSPSCSWRGRAGDAEIQTAGNSFTLFHDHGYVNVLFVAHPARAMEDACQELCNALHTLLHLQASVRTFTPSCTTTPTASCRREHCLQYCGYDTHEQFVHMLPWRVSSTGINNPVLTAINNLPGNPGTTY